MFTYLLRDAVDISVYRRRELELEDKEVRLPNCPTLDLMKIKVFLLGPKTIHQMSKLV